MSAAIVTLCTEGAKQAFRLLPALADARIYVHESADPGDSTLCFSSVIQLTAEIFAKYKQLIYIAPTGVAVRAIAPCIRHKLCDPAVVVVDVGGRYAISLLSGHEGGANALALTVANALGAEPVISTTTEALKTIIVGVGCRRGTPEDRIAGAICEALARASASLDEVRVLASADLKANEPGLLQAARRLGLSLRLISSAEIISTTRTFQHSAFVEEKVNLPAVAEPAALLAGRRTQLILPKTIIDGVTVAIARENCL